jgi:translation elongation factor P/translation initiation factor 5A
MAGYVQTGFKSLTGNKAVNLRLRTNDPIEQTELPQSVDYQFLYGEEFRLNFMNMETYEQVACFPNECISLNKFRVCED